MFRKIPAPIRFILVTYLCGIIFFTSLRLLLFLLHLSASGEIPAFVILNSFLIGLQFDTVVSGYILAIPLVIYFFTSLFVEPGNYLNRIIFWFIFLLYSLSFIVICADIQWFNHQQTRITTAALEWTESPGMMFGIIFKDPLNYPYLLLLVALIITFYFFERRNFKRQFSGFQLKKKLLTVTLIYFLSFGLTFLAIRGRVAIKSPIRWGTAFVSEYNFTNQLGLNPVYTFLQSALDQKNISNRNVDYMNVDSALELIRNYYHTPLTSQTPVERFISSSSPMHYNVVLVLMESMTSYNMQAFGNKESLTPFLDKLYKESIVFPDFYSDGIHTFCGVYSSLFGMPSLPNRHHMKDLKNQQPYGGIAKTLSTKGYETFFFTTHDDQFDNMGGFLSPNGYRHLISQKDYPGGKILNTLGVPDHILFEEVISHINSVNSKPFFAAALTASNHGPYEIPPGINFKPRSSDTRKQLIEYADWSIGRFIENAMKQAWFDSTIFIFTGDHGALVEGVDNNLSFHRIPLIIYAPKIFSPEVKSNLGGQVDIYATIMGILNESYVNNSFGVDLFHGGRKWITFSYDDEYGAFGKHVYYSRRKNGDILSGIQPDEKSVRPLENNQMRDSMMDYTKAVFQSIQWMIDNRKMR